MKYHLDYSVQCDPQVTPEQLMVCDLSPLLWYDVTRGGREVYESGAQEKESGANGWL